MIAVEITEYCDSTVKTGRLQAVLLGGGVSVIIVIGLETSIQYLCRHVTFVRKQIDPRSRFEGHWIITIPENAHRPYAYACIEYQAESDSFRYRGAAFNEKGEMGSDWLCPSISIDLAKDEVRFFAEGVIHADREDLTNFGWIRFERVMFSRKLRYARGRGSFVDCGRNVAKFNFYLDRLEPSFVHEAISKQEVVSHEDMSWLIRYVHEYRQLSHEVKGYHNPNDSREHS